MLWIVIKPLLFAVCFVFGCASLLAQKPGWQPSPGHTQVPIWPKTPPDAQFGPPPNTETMPEPGEIDNVSRPTITVYSPKEKNTGAAVVVFRSDKSAKARKILGDALDFHSLRQLVEIRLKLLSLLRMRAHRYNF